MQKIIIDGQFMYLDTNDNYIYESMSDYEAGTPYCHWSDVEMGSVTLNY